MDRERRRSRNPRLTGPRAIADVLARELDCGDFVVPVGLEERTGDDMRLWAAGVTALAALAALAAMMATASAASRRSLESAAIDSRAAAGLHRIAARQGDARDLLGSRRRPRTLQPSVGRHAMTSSLFLLDAFIDDMTPC